MANNHDTPITPTHILDPYPERLSRVAGACETAEVATVDVDASTRPLPKVNQTPFAASLRPSQRTIRVGRWPLGSTVLASLAQMVLAAAISAGRVPIAIGVACTLAALVCGLLLIAAQCLSIAGQR